MHIILLFLIAVIITAFGHTILALVWGIITALISTIFAIVPILVCLAVGLIVLSQLFG